MKTNNIFIGIFFLMITSLLQNLYAQDKIYFTDGSSKEVKIEEVTEDKLKYRNYNNLTGPLYSKELESINYVIYENGAKEYFSNKEDEQNSEFNENKYSNSKSFQKSNSQSNAVIYEEEIDYKTVAKVHKLNGIDIYCLSLPVLSYENAFSSGNFMSDFDAKSLLTGGLSRADVDDKMNKIVNAALKQAEKEGVKIDGIIYSGGNRAIAIRYVDGNIPSQPLAVPQRLNGIYIYAFSEPNNSNYDVIIDAKAKSGGFTSGATYGLVNSTIDDDLNKMVERMRGKNKNLDAVIYGVGKKGVGIRFNN